MWGIFTTECVKLFRGRQVWMSVVIFALIPVLIALMVTQQGENVAVQGTFNLATFTFAVIGLLRSLLVIYLVAIIMSATTLAREWEDGVLKMIVVRLPNRWSLYLSKFLAVNAVMLCMMIVIVLFSVLSFLIFVSNTDLVSTLTAADAWSVLYAVLAAMGGVAVVVAATLLCSMFLGFTGAFMGGIGFVIVSKVLEQWDVVATYVPTVLSDAARFLANTEDATRAVTQSVWMLPLYVLILVVPGLIWIEKKDITR